MGRPKKQTSLNPQVFALSRDIVTDNQVRWDEDTIKWGPDDALPLRIMDAVNRSPTASTCLDIMGNFIRGDGFTDPELENLIVDEEGTTLIDFHSQLVDYMKLLDAFSVNIKVNQKGLITNAYVIGPETVRFVKYQGTKVKAIKRNPYFGTSQYLAENTCLYPVYNPATSKEIIQSVEDPGKFEGMMYFWGAVKPPYKFYPVAKYWSAEKWIYVDAEIQTFHKSNLDNGFFQSALINIIGDPNQPSKNPRYMAETEGTDGVKRKKATKTVGEEFNEQMSTIFSGARKAGTAMTIWSESEDKAIKVSNFPVNTQFDVLSGTFQDAIKGICIATGVDPILLAIQGNGLSNAGDSIRAVINYSQSKVKGYHYVLENFYNKILLPNLQTKTKAQVKIRPYVPIATSLTVEDKFWEVLTDQEKKDFVKQNVSGMSEIIKDTAPLVDENGEPLTVEEQVLNDNISQLNMRQIIRLNKIGQQFARGEINLDQAKVLLKNYGLNDMDINAWLGLPVEGVTK